MSISVRVLTPNNIVFSEIVEEVILPGLDGEIGILEGHCTLVTILNKGILKLKVCEKWINMTLYGGQTQSHINPFFTYFKF
jgi:F-type H+-transporting ATPase subunit epsilon